MKKTLIYRSTKDLGQRTAAAWWNAQPSPTVFTMSSQYSCKGACLCFTSVLSSMPISDHKKAFIPSSQTSPTQFCTAMSWSYISLPWEVRIRTLQNPEKKIKLCWMLLSPSNTRGSPVAWTQSFLLLGQLFGRISGFLLPSWCFLTNQALSLPSSPVLGASLQLQGKTSHFACMAASAFQADLYEMLPPCTICIHTKVPDLHKMRQENHLSLLSEKVNGMDSLQMFTIKCFLSLWAIEFVHKRGFTLFPQSHNPICFRLTWMTSTSLELIHCPQSRAWCYWIISLPSWNAIQLHRRGQGCRCRC